MNYPIPTNIYHITHIDNLESIINDDLLCLGELSNKEYYDISYPGIQERRARTPVPLEPYGNLHDYVPFFYCIRPPMLYTIANNNVEGAINQQEKIIYFVTTIQELNNNGLSFVFTDGHAIMGFTEFFNNLNDLSNIDWELMQARYWSDTEEDNDRKRRRQAEFLVFRVLPWYLINSICCCNSRIREQIVELLIDCAHQPEIHINSDWYY